ncbi:HNH endonuclease [Paenibacillus sp. P32E]|uniref:HNH endonuclease n=1 Tax=Paenibacillus sp. P32E TaxID=1349434 RepID=UPI00093A87CC|nr:HNH endonuclease [Paenibacillus sp. P32E]OKP91390.1 hypothetical protein A3848_09810 [Paenibacillus sp. P32E]
MKNSYEIRGDTTAIFIKRPDGTYLETLIDTEDLPKLEAFYGSLRATRYDQYSQYYVYGTIDHFIEIRKRTVKKQVSLHRFLMGFPKDLVVDHINEDTLDNRRSINLQAISNGENVKKSAHKRNRVFKRKLQKTWVSCNVTEEQRAEIMLRAENMGMDFRYWLSMVISRELGSTPWYEVADEYAENRRAKTGEKLWLIGSSVDDLKQVD